MGERVTDAVRVDAPLAIVEDVITDLERYPEWADAIVEVEVLKRDESGRPLLAHFAVNARVLDVDYELEYDYGGEIITWRLRNGDLVSQLEGAYTLSESVGGTHVHYELEVDVQIPLPAFLKARAARQILETGLQGLKRRSEEFHAQRGGDG